MYIVKKVWNCMVIVIGLDFGCFFLENEMIEFGVVFGVVVICLVGYFEVRFLGGLVYRRLVVRGWIVVDG